MRAYRLFIFLIFQFILLRVVAQSLFPVEHGQGLYQEQSLNFQHDRLRTDVRPLIEDSLMFEACTYRDTTHKWLRRKLFHEHFLFASHDRFAIAADPLFDFQLGYDVVNKGMTYKNGRGLQILGAFGDVVSFQTMYLETQERFLPYLDDYIQKYEVIPGNSRIKDFKGSSFDYGSAMANISFNPWKFLNVQLGYGKNFFGNGYRSLLLSDNAFQYPYLKLTTRLGNFEYVNIFASFQNLDTDSILDAPIIWYNGYQKKGATFNYLSYQPVRWIEFGVFEGIIWKSRELHSPAFNINQFIPVIFVNALRYGLFSDENIILGLNLDVRPLRMLHFYGQFALDDVHLKKPASGSGYQKTKFGYQLGAKWFAIGGVDNLILQVEYNEVRPYTYGHKDALQSYTHNNQALAHPLGANFREIVSFLEYKVGRFYAEVQFNYAYSGADTNSSHWGSNIFYSDTRGERGYNSFGNEVGQGLRRDLTCAGVKAGYLFNPRYQLCVEGGVWIRNSITSLESQKSMMFWLGLRTKLWNQYFDW